MFPFLFGGPAEPGYLAPFRQWASVHWYVPGQLVYPAADVGLEFRRVFVCESGNGTVLESDAVEPDFDSAIDIQDHVFEVGGVIWTYLGVDWVDHDRKPGVWEASTYYGKYVYVTNAGHVYTTYPAGADSAGYVGFTSGVAPDWFTVYYGWTDGQGDEHYVGDNDLYWQDLGVGELVLKVASRLSTPFDMADFIGKELETPFDMERADVASELSTPFDLMGRSGSELSTPFDMDGIIGMELSTPFDMVAATTQPEWGYFDDTGFHPDMLVFDKGGNPLGSISLYSITGPPTQALMTARSSTAASGNMTFHVPRTEADGQTPNDEASLIFDDRIVVVGVEVGGPLWAGSIQPQESSAGIIQAECVDLFGQLVNTSSLDIDEPVSDNTPAWTLAQMVLDRANTRKASDNELLWRFEHSGTRPYRGGKFTYTGDVIGALEDIVENAGVEMMWRATIEGGNLVATLIQSDRFETISAHAITDGPGGNVMARPRIIRDPTRVVHEIQVTGETTNLSDCIPDYAQWAIRDSTPTVTVSTDPGPLRRRARLDVSVPWGYSQSTTNELCQATLDGVFDMFYSYLRAIHDIEGRPFHDGYLFEGPRDVDDASESGHRALSASTWRTRLQLVETYENTPASAIMISDSQVQNNRHTWLIVTYNRRTGVQSVRAWAFPSTRGASMSKFYVPDLKTWTRYTVSGGRIIARNNITIAPGLTDGYSAFCESYGVRVYDPVNRRYMRLRRIISGANYGKYINPADPDITIRDLGAGAGIDMGSLSQLIGKVYDFELYNIDKWDPYRDGIGELFSAKTVFNGTHTSRERWHIVPYNSGSNATTTLSQGISASTQDIVVTTIAGWPTPESDDFPYKAAIDDGPDREAILITGQEGLEWHVTRAQDGTAAIVHEPGAPVHRLGSTVPEGLTPLNPPWPEGEAYARELLDLLSHATTTIELDIANINDDWREADFGAVMPVTIGTEGIDDGFSGTARVIGRSPDPFGASGQPGSMTLVLEVVTEDG